jgi:hypothetical protein
MYGHSNRIVYASNSAYVPILRLLFFLVRGIPRWPSLFCIFRGSTVASLLDGFIDHLSRYCDRCYQDVDISLNAYNELASDHISNMVAMVLRGSPASCINLK